MGYEVFTEDWSQAWKDDVNQSERYKKSARSWEWPLVFLMDSDPDRGIEADRAVYVDLYHGVCREARVATLDDINSAPYIVRADAETWRDLRDGSIEPIAAILRGRMVLERGSMLVLARYVAAATELCRAVARIGTVFPDEE